MIVAEMDLVFLTTMAVEVTDWVVVLGGVGPAVATKDVIVIITCRALFVAPGTATITYADTAEDLALDSEPPPALAVGILMMKNKIKEIDFAGDAGWGTGSRFNMYDDGSGGGHNDSDGVIEGAGSGYGDGYGDESFTTEKRSPRQGNDYNYYCGNGSGFGFDAGSIRKSGHGNGDGNGQGYSDCTGAGERRAEDF